MEVEYIYLIVEREFVKTKESIFKVGKTTQNNHDRLKQYPKGSVLLAQFVCDDCHSIEKEILKAFRKLFISRRDIGAEYFEGDYPKMIQTIFNIINYKFYMLNTNNTVGSAVVEEEEDCNTVVTNIQTLQNNPIIEDTSSQTSNIVSNYLQKINENTNNISTIKENSEINTTKKYNIVSTYLEKIKKKQNAGK
jgi:hypothetical protein